MGSFAGWHQIRLVRLAWGAIVALLPFPQPSVAESLSEALTRVYQSNPVLNFERARLRHDLRELARNWSRIPGDGPVALPSTYLESVGIVRA